MWIVVSIVLFGAVFYLIRVSLLGTKLSWVTQRTDLTDRQKRQSVVGVALPSALESVWLLALHSTTSQLASPWVLGLELRWLRLSSSPAPRARVGRRSPA